MPKKKTKNKKIRGSGKKYSVLDQNCTRSDGKKGSYVLKIKPKPGKYKGRERDSQGRVKIGCHTSVASANAQRSAIEAGKDVVGPLLSEFINDLVQEVENIHVSPPPEDSIEELYEVIKQYYDRVMPEEMQYDLDENVASMFYKVILQFGMDHSLENIKSLQDEVTSSVIYHKNYFNRARPSEYAKKLAIEWEGDDDAMSTTNTPSYPSGHTCQAYYLAHTLSDQFPDLKEPFLNLAEAVAQSRVDRGVHYPSDLEGGKELAWHLYKTNKKKTIPESFAYAKRMDDRAIDRRIKSAKTIGEVAFLLAELDKKAKEERTGRFIWDIILSPVIAIKSSVFSMMKKLYGLANSFRKGQEAGEVPISNDDIKQYPILDKMDLDMRIFRLVDERKLTKWDDEYLAYLQSLPPETPIANITNINMFMRKKYMQDIAEIEASGQESWLKETIKEYLSHEDMEDIKQTAHLVHLGQKRRDDTPYITHPIAVYNITKRYYPDNVPAQMLAILHDTLEDADKVGNVTKEEAEAMIGASIHDPAILDDINRALAILTHDKSVEYSKYLQSALNDPLAGIVKVSDLMHNLSHNPSERQILKYKTALGNVRIPSHISPMQMQQLYKILERR